MSASSFAGKPAKSKIAEPSEYFFAGVDGGAKNALPATVQQAVDALRCRETTRSHDLEERLNKAWTDVEEWITLNERRASDLEALKLNLGTIQQDVTFWTDDTVTDYLGLRSFLDEAIDVDGVPGTSSAGDAASTLSSETRGLDKKKLPSVAASGNTCIATAKSKKRSRVVFKSTRQQQPVVVQPAEAQVGESVPSAPGPLAPTRPPRSASEAPGASSAVILDAADSNAPLRRVFGTMLQRRNELPRDLTILFTALDGLQKNELLEVEEQLKTCALSACLHLPFVKIQQFIMRNLAKPSHGAVMERNHFEAADPVCKELDARYQTLRSLWSKTDTCSERKADATQAMWNALAAELEARRKLNADCVACTAACVEFEAQLEQDLPALLDRCVKDVNEEFSLIEKDATEAFSTTNELYRIAEEATAASSARYNTERSALLEGIKASEYQTRHSQQQQEKMIRRIREAVKELRVEQGRHEVHLNDLVTQRVRLEQLDASYAQFRTALENRKQMMSEAHVTCTSLNDILVKVGEARDKALQQVRFHVTRSITEERLRCRRMVDRTVQNCQAWARVTSDIAALFEARREHVLQKSDESWQLSYLFAGEKTRTMANIEAIYAEYKKIESVWKVCEMEQERHEIAPTSLEQLEKVDLCQVTRRAMLDLDDERGIAKASLVVQELLFAEKDQPCAARDATDRLLAMCSARRKGLQLPSLKSSVTQSAALNLKKGPTAPRPPPRGTKHLS